jgi:hypothetical protein
LLKRFGQDELDRSCEKLRRITYIRGERNVVQTIKHRKANCFGHNIRRDCSLHVIEGNIEGDKSDGKRRKKT